MRRSKWVWMPHPGHFICASECQFVLNTYVGGFIVSTVGEYIPSEISMKIKMESRGVATDKKGDALLAQYLDLFGYEDIGCNRKYETMVFKAKKISNRDCCMYRASDFGEVDFDGYMDAVEATKGHYEMCQKWSSECHHLRLSMTTQVNKWKQQLRSMEDSFVRWYRTQLVRTAVLWKSSKLCRLISHKKQSK